MRRLAILPALAVIAAALPAAAFERDMLNLSVPTDVADGDAVVEIQHRFKGPVDEDPLGTAFGMGVGANVALSFRYVVWRRLELGPAYTFANKEYTIRAGQSMDAGDFMDVKLDVEFFSYELAGITARRQNFFYNVACRGEPLWGIFSPALNLAYDGYEQRMGAGLGFAAGIDREGLVKHVALIGEYYPVLGRDDDRTGPEDAFAAGVELQTYGHHFEFLVGNSAEVGPRRLMLGAAGNRLYCGFNIYRLIEL